MNKAQAVKTYKPKCFTEYTQKYIVGSVYKTLKVALEMGLFLYYKIFHSDLLLNLLFVMEGLQP